MRAPLFLLALAACGGAEVREPTPSGATSGSEAPAEEPQEATTEASSAILPGTIPVPVPQPAVARPALSETLQSLWTGVEEAVQETMPPPPEGSDAPGISRWAEETFTPWLEGRLANAREIRALATELPEAPHEQVVGAALFGYLFEDIASAPRGAPVPNSVATDPELLSIYIDSLTAALRPVAQSAFDAYVFCAEQVATELAESGWGEWGVYCYQRASDMNETFQIVAPE